MVYDVAMKNLFLILLLIPLSLDASEKDHELIMATLYVQSSAEFYANSSTIYRAAQNNLDALLSDKNHTAALEQLENFSDKPPAIILDVDQTVLDNSAYQARIIEKGTAYPDGWFDWAKEEKAEFMPGALEFMEYAQSKGVEIFFVTNRDLEIEKATINNYIALGFSTSSEENILSRGENGWGSNKTSRRELIAKDYRIVMMFGDNFGDFVDNNENLLSPKDRVEAIKKYSKYWGTSWYMFSNPMYGAWEGSVIDFNYRQPRDELLQKKLDALDSK